MARSLYAFSTGATAYTSTAALQNALGVFSSATDFGLQLCKYRIGFNGVTASNTPVTIRFGTCTYATNPPGTNSTSATIFQESGRVIAATNITAGYNWTAGNEPTVKTYLGDAFILTPNGGVVLYDFPLGDEPDTFTSGNTGFFIETTAAQTVGVVGSMWFSRI